MSGQERRRGWPQWRGEHAPEAPVDPDLRSDAAPVSSSGAIAGPAYARGTPDPDWRVREPEMDWRTREAEWDAQVPQLERLHALNRRLLELHDETALMRETMQAAAELTRAQAATAQLRAGSGLRLVATSGLPEEAMDPYRFVDVNGISTCAAALRERRRVLVVNFDFAPGFAAFAREAAALHLRAAVSTPVLNEDGEVVAMFTLYFDRPFQPSARELRILDLCAQQVAPQLSRAQVAAELRDSAGLNRVLMESGTDCLQMLDLQGRVLSINAQGRRVLGLDERTQVEGRFLHEMMDPGCRAQVEAAIAAGRAGIPQRLETFGRGADGTPKWWSSNLSLVPDAQGRPGHLLLVSRDITAGKRDEYTYAEEKRVLDMVSAGRPLSECLDALTELVSRMDPSAHASVLAADEATGGFAGGRSAPDPRVAGEPPGASSGTPAWPMPVSTFPLPTPASHSEAIFVRGKRAGSFLIEVDRPGVPDAWHRRVATFGAHIAGVMLERDCDISEREQAHRRMLDSVNHERAVLEDAERLGHDSRWLAAIVQSAPDAIFGEDPDGIISSWNDGAERLFGYTAAEAIGQPGTLLAPPERAGEETDVLARIRAGEAVGHRETVRRHKHGNLIDISLTIAPVRDARGGVAGSSWIARGIDARKQVERERESALAGEREARREADGLLETSHTLASDPESGELMQKLTDMATRLIGAEYGAFLCNAGDGHGDSYRLQALAGADKPQSGDMPMPRSTTLSRFAFAYGEVVRCGDVSEISDPDKESPWLDLPAVRLPVRSYLAVPVASARNGRVHGGLVFAHSEPDRFDERAQRLVQGIAAQVAVALDGTQASRSKALSEAYFLQIIDAMPAAVFAADAQGRLTHFNDAAVEFVGGEPELGSDTWSTGWKFFRADGMPLQQNPLQVSHASSEDAVSGAELIAERPDGARRWIVPYPVALRDAQGKPTGSINMLVDVSARRHAETALASEHARTGSQHRLFDAILANSLDLIYTFDLEHRFIHANDAQLAMWGKSREEAIGKNYLELGYPGWQAAMHDRELDQVIASKRPLRGEVPFTGSFGRRIYEYVFVPVLGPGESVEAVAGISRDITEQKEIERRQRFLLDLSDRLRLLDDANAIRHTAAETLARELGVSAAGFVEIEPAGDTLIAGGEFCDGRTPDISGRRFSENGAGSGYAPLVLAGENIFIEDYEAEMRKAGSGVEYGRELGLSSGAGVALYDQGKRTAYMYLMHPQPRAWPEADRQLVREVAERAWSAVERVRAMEATRRSEAELSGAFGDIQLLTSVGAEMVRAPDADTVFVRIAEAATQLMRAECAILQVFDRNRNELRLLAQTGLSEETRRDLEQLSGDSRLPGAVALRTGERVIIGDVRQDTGLAGSAELALIEREGINAVQSTPLLARSGRAVGVLSTQWRQRHVPDERKLALLDLLARQAADLIDSRGHERELRELNAFLERRVSERAADLERSEEQVRRMASMLTMTEHAERRRISRVLHDELQQQLQGIQAKLAAARSAIGHGEFASAIDHLEEAENWSESETVAAARHLTSEPDLPVPKDAGLAESLDRLVAQMCQLHGLDVILAGERELQLHDEAKRVLVCQLVRELLFNVVIHANTGSARVELRRAEGNVEIRVADEGVGFDPQKLRHEPKSDGSSSGLDGARERLAAVGGRLYIESAPGFGACIILRMPVDGMPLQETDEDSGQATPQASEPGIDIKPEDADQGPEYWMT